ncbi:MAG: DUF2905 domain-containing protein [Verrucomicrobiae bacterium]|nr:DUF2905 domain-containing protein [Verrucomicrobiae bacterium]
MTEFGKTLVVIGLGLAVVGGILWLASGCNLPLGRLPGDVRVERPNFRFYFPITTCLLLSVILTLILWLLRKR